MIASSQNLKTSSKMPVQIGNLKKEHTSNGFANLLTNATSKNLKNVSKPSVASLINIPTNIEVANTKDKGNVGKPSATSLINTPTITKADNVKGRNAVGKFSNIPFVNTATNIKAINTKNKSDVGEPSVASLINTPTNLKRIKTRNTDNISELLKVAPNSTTKNKPKTSLSSVSELEKIKKDVPKPDIDLSVLGEVEEDKTKAKKGIKKLGDLLAELSHKSTAPIGSEVINLKTVLGSKNDDPILINKDILTLVVPNDRAKVMNSLINDAKQFLTNKLQSFIPKNRIPKTLKGLLETAIRFNIVVNDIKLETLPKNKINQALLKALKEPMHEAVPLPVLISKVDLDLKKIVTKKTDNDSLLKEALNSNLNNKSSKIKEHDKETILQKPAQTKSNQELLAQNEVTKTNNTHEKNPLENKIVAQPNISKPLVDDKEKERKKLDTKIDSKVTTKEDPLPEGLKGALAADINNKISQQKNSISKQSISADEVKQSIDGEKIDQESNLHQNSMQNKQDLSIGMKTETNMSVKIAEAKQLVGQLSQNIRHAIENYKPPFTKLNLKLTPERLGDIDVMMVQRGNNIHINLTSNSVALGVLQQNSPDLKTALNDAGLGNATMNFSSNGQNRNQQHNASERYTKMSKLIEDIDDLELIIPRYV